MKNNKKREAVLVAGGIVLGIAITGPVAQAAEMLTSQRSTQKIYVNGQQVQMEAYSISGSNYVKLRDIGKAVDFSVTYDPLTNAVQINTAEPYTDEAPAQFLHTVTLPADGSKYVPKVGDHILCDDGTDYAITDVRRWEMNISPLPGLPSATCDWSKFPTLELPQAEARHFTDQDRDILFVRNLYETHRMQYTIYNALGGEPNAWKNGKPLATVQLTIPADLEPYTASMWPWHGSDLEEPAQQRILHRSLGLLPQRRLPAHAILCSVAVKGERIMASIISRL